MMKCLSYKWLQVWHMGPLSLSLIIPRGLQQLLFTWSSILRLLSLLYISCPHHAASLHILVFKLILNMQIFIKI